MTNYKSVQKDFSYGLLKVKCTMFKILIALLLFINPLFADEYEQSKLTIFSKLLPRFVLMSSQKTKLKNTIKICLTSEYENNIHSNYLKEKLENNSIANFQNTIIDTNYNNLFLCRNADIVFMFNSEQKTFSKAIEYFNNKEILTISYDPFFLTYGANISLYFGNKVQPFINVKSITQKNIQLDNILLRISKIYRENSE